MKYFIATSLLLASLDHAIAYTTPGKTAEDQNMTQNDTAITRTIREKLTSDSSLSINAQNIKVISENGRVILKGPVASAEEKRKVESIAKGVAGKTAVINNTTVNVK
jgi:osmotically-inducible protein OsmY